MWLPMAVTLAVLAVISGVVVYAVNMVNKVEDNLKPEENATRWWRRSRRWRSIRAMW